MTNYTKTTDFAAKDALPSGNAAKIVKGSEIDAEFNNIATSSATKANKNNSALTGTTTFETISDGTIAITAFVDEDNMVSNSATLLPTQQSVKAYVDSQVTAQDLDFQADTGGALSIDLDSETLTFTGGTGVDTSGSGNAVTFAIDSTVATLTGTQTLTNKTLTSPTLNTPTIGTSFTIGSATITEAELEILDGATVTTAELNVLDGITSTTAELNILDGVTSTAAELNILDGVTSTAAELNILDGVTSTTAELNILDGVTSTTAELNILDGVTATTAELNIMDGVTSTTAELNILDGVTATATELNLLDGVTATTAELNYVDGVTSAIQTQIDTKAPLASPTFTGTVTAAGLTVDTDTLVVDATNNRVGIGTISPDRILDIEASVPAVRLTDTTTAGMYHEFVGDGNSLSIEADDGNVGASSSINFKVDGSEKVRITSAGSVGIGTTSPGRKFTVQGGSGDTLPVRIIGGSGTTTSGLEFQDPSTTADYKVQVGSVGDNLYLRAGGAERMRIDSSGNLLVGTTSTAPTSGSGFSVQSIGRIFSSVDGGYVASLNRDTSNGEILRFRKDGSTVGSVSVTASATTYNTSSDQRLKENIADADDAGNKVDAIQVRKFDWIADGSHQDYGMVAQELQSVAPEAVSAPADPDEMMGVDYSKLVPMLVKEIQALRARVQQLENN